MTRKAKTYVGELVSDDLKGVTFVDLVTNRKITIQKRDIRKFTQPATLEEAARTAGLPAVTAWKISKLASRNKPVGKIARVTSQIVYITLGSTQGIQNDQKLTVYRNKGEIRDPDTGKVLAIERPKIAQLRVVEVSEKFSKAKITGDLEVALKVGDEVESSSGKMLVAVCPIYHENGSLTNIGAKLGEDITTLLVQRKVPVVERTVLDTVLPELIAQNTLLFDPKIAQKLGKLSGASVVVTGKIVPLRNTGTAYIRMVDVQTGKILFAASSKISLGLAKVVKGTSGGSNGSSSSSSSSTKSSSRSKSSANLLGRSRKLPRFLTTGARLKRTKDRGVRILQGGPIKTRDRTFLTKDFTFEVLLSFERGDKIAYIGIGAGKEHRSYNGLTDSVYLRFHSPWHGDGQMDVTPFRGGYTPMGGSVKHQGKHLVRIIKEGDTVTFFVDPDNDSPSDDDLEMTIQNIKEFAPFLNSKNSNLFFGGSGTFYSAKLIK